MSAPWLKYQPAAAAPLPVADPQAAAAPPAQVALDPAPQAAAAGPWARYATPDAAPPPAPAAGAPPLIFKGSHGISVEVGGSDPTPPPAAPPDAQAPTDDQGFWGNLGSAFAAPWVKTGHDLAEEYRRNSQPRPQSSGPLDSLMQFGGDVAHNVIEPFRLAGDVLGDAFSPVGAALNAVVAQPGANLLDRIPLQAYSMPQLQWGPNGPSFDPAHPLSASGKHAANLEAINLALSGAPATSDLVPGGQPWFGMGEEGLAAARGAQDARQAAQAASDAAAAPAPASRDTTRAARYVSRVMNSAGVTPEDLAAAGGPHLPITAAEAIGSPAEVQLGSIAKQTGTTGDDLGALINERQITRGPRVLQSFADAAGVQPEAALGNIDAIVKQGQAEAAPLFDAAFAEDSPYARNAWSRTLEDLTPRDAIQKAMKKARVIMSNEGVSPETLGAGFVENPEQWASYEPPPFEAPEAAGNPVGFAGFGRGPARAPSAGPSLAKFIADNGGIVDTTGDVTAMGGDHWHLGKTAQAKLIATPSRGGGMFGSTAAWSREPDAVAQRAWEAGYFPQHEQAPTINELYDALGTELRGKPIYAREPDARAQLRYDRANAAEELAYRGGDPADLPHPEDYVGRPEPKSEPAQQMVPKPQYWHFVKRALDDELKPYYDDPTKQDETFRSIEGVRSALVGELRRLNPDYANALDRSSEYLGARQAFRDGNRMLLEHRVNEHDFAERLQQLSPPEMMAFRAGMANRLYDAAQRGKFDPKVLLGPRVGMKLRMALSEKRAQQLVDAALGETKMLGFERRYGPKANSVTMELQAAQADQEGRNALGDAASKALSHGHGGITGFLAHLIRAQAEGLADRLITRNLPASARNDAGRMLMSTPPSVLAEELRQVLGAPKTSSVNWRGMMGMAATQHAADEMRKAASGHSPAKR